jgi:hypothetical protein
MFSGIELGELDEGGAQPVVYLFGFPAARPYGLPSHSGRLNGAGLTGHPALAGLKWTSCPFLP